MIDKTYESLIYIKDNAEHLQYENFSINLKSIEGSLNNLKVNKNNGEIVISFYSNTDLHTKLNMANINRANTLNKKMFRSKNETLELILLAMQYNLTNIISNIKIPNDENIKNKILEKKKNLKT